MLSRGYIVAIVVPEQELLIGFLCFPKACRGLQRTGVDFTLGFMAFVFFFDLDFLLIEEKDPGAERGSR